MADFDRSLATRHTLLKSLGVESRSTRRKFIKGLGFVGALLLAAQTGVMAMMFSSPSGQALRNAEDRVIFNMNYSYIDNDFKFINRFGPSGLLPEWSTWIGATNFTSDMVDENGYPLSTAHAGRMIGGVRLLPSAVQSRIVIKWDGQGTLQITEISGTFGTWSAVGGTAVNCSFSATASGGSVIGSGSGASIELDRVGGSFGSTNLRITATTGGDHLRNLRFYYKADEADFLAGKLYRRGYKDTLIKLNPGALRFLWWIEPASFIDFTTRLVPGESGVTKNLNNQSPPYLTASFSGTSNQYTLASATGMPGSMQNGEVVLCRFGTTSVKGGRLLVSSIPQTVNPVVTVTTAHSYVVGDKVLFLAWTNASTFTGMQQMHMVVANVLDVPSSTEFQIDVDTTSFTANVANVLYCCSYVSLDVGGRGAYPIIHPQTGLNNSSANMYEQQPVNWAITGDIAVDTYRFLRFDKSMKMNSTLDGAWVVYPPGHTNGSANGCVPLEYCIKLINELNEETTKGPINAYVLIPVSGILEGGIDEDYTVDREFAVNTCNVCLNGANGYAGLDPRARLLVEYGNEQFNPRIEMWTSDYCVTRGRRQWGTQPWGNYVNLAAFATFKGCIMAYNITQAFPAEVASKRITLMQSSGQYASYVDGNQLIGINGNTQINTDPLNTWGGAAPCTLFHHYLTTNYMGGYWSGLAGWPTDPEVLAATWQAAVNSGDLATASATISTMVDAMNSTFGGNSIQSFLQSIWPTNQASLTKAGGGSLAMYEGGWDWAVTESAFAELGPKMSATKRAFLLACAQSPQWATMSDYFIKQSNALGIKYPACLNMMGFYSSDTTSSGWRERWGYAWPSTVGPNNVEGSQLLSNPCFAAIVALNNSAPD